MQKRYLPFIIAIVIDALALGLAGAILAFGYWLFTGASGAYLSVLSNLLFFEGGLLVLVGSFLEFFHVKGTGRVMGLLLYPLHILPIGKGAGQQSPDQNGAEPEAGWTLIFLGLALIALSFIAVYQYII